MHIKEFVNYALCNLVSNFNTESMNLNINYKESALLGVVYFLMPVQGTENALLP